MQIIHLIVNHYNFYCPVTGECISADGEPVNHGASSLCGYWVSVERESPIIRYQDFEDAYHAYLKKCMADSEADGADGADGADYVPDWQELEVFLEEYDRPNWVVFSITTRLSDQDSTDAWYVIDLSKRNL